MDKMISLKNFLKEFKTSGFILNCRMPMEYSEGLPVLGVKNDSLCLTVPFLKYKMTGVVDKTLVFPVRYTVTLCLPDMDIVGFEDLSYNRFFKNIDFSKPVGLFRHEEIKNLSKSEYEEKRERLLLMYEKTADMLLFGSKFTKEEQDEMSGLLRRLLEPSLYPFYKYIDEDFFNKYLS